jgi:hypothetical protein
MFQLVGLEEEDLDKDNGYVSGVSDFNNPELNTLEKFIRKPRVLCQFPFQAESRQVYLRKDVIKDFAFPNGVTCKKIQDFDDE